tara:strand:- start:747 stop:1403 length:657 start_codon:yes stop_codon:yes gene_type:complete
MASERLPGKMLLKINGIPIIEWVFRRIIKCKMIDQVVFAIPESSKDDVLEEYLINLKAEVYRGDEFDLVGRFYEAAKLWEAKVVVRVCADNPFVDAIEIDKAIRFYHLNQFDYVYNHIPKDNNYADGLGAEVISMNTLGLINKKSTKGSQREHVMNYIWDNPKLFRVSTFNPEDSAIAFPSLRLDIDTIEDFEKFKNLEIKPDSLSKDIIKLIINKSK